MINYVMLVSRQGAPREMVPDTAEQDEGQDREGCDAAGARATNTDVQLPRVQRCVIYRRYASLFFITSITPGENELITLEVIHRYVEVLDRYFGNLDLIFNFQKAYAILDELIIAGELQESSKKAVLKIVAQSDAIEEGELA
ncbi:hypothetical protein A1Q1_06644 [Trichosporon asahii var. asahii CBS 2479]|uniref:AP complex subunit sigma n=1 Tax=Trichosporon asahii var. asahii (strain ATCC 90039 / CBS 2479 / JCM 2466 / KCTC 7840 / NBRC 103889/ NCYC 2677 / UAMH 7654) TaxID=1186058 RepID=J5TQ78_TRIAS|nr:hypothetical protein A1Q1_06644 [Trichosporon asahii var. asahii CBS 2479]EJT52106.1 hypothetical protein A1Q1_06644 [Trichosporon asahii var. asahii CBS 2479]